LTFGLTGTDRQELPHQLPHPGQAERGVHTNIIMACDK